MDKILWKYLKIIDTALPQDSYLEICSILCPPPSACGKQSLCWVPFLELGSGVAQYGCAPQVSSCYHCDQLSQNAEPAPQRPAQKSLSHQAKDFSELLCFLCHFLPSPLRFLFFLPLSPPPAHLSALSLLSENRNKCGALNITTS